MTGLLDEILTRLQVLPDTERRQVLDLAHQGTRGMRWVPNPGPQTEAFFCQADELFYGGEAGGGKSDLLLGTALNNQRRSLILRRLNGEVEGLVDRLQEIIGTSSGVKRNPPASYRTRERLIMFGGCQHLDDRKKYQGSPKDFIGFDEIQNFLEAQYTFIIAWARSTIPGQRVRVVATGNPPTTPEGMWVLKRWGAWLDPAHPNPALPGELRWYTTIDGKDTEVDGPGPVMIDGKPLLDEKGKPVIPKSRTFIPAELADNPDLDETGYGATLAGLPEELRRSLKEGDFTAGLRDDPWQVFPTEWVNLAFDRWAEGDGLRTPMNVLGVDIAQGGNDQTILAPRHGSWYAPLIVYPGKETPDGPTVAGLVVMNMRNGCEIIIDMGGGHGGSTRDHLKANQIDPTLFVGSEVESIRSYRDRTGTLRFANLRAAAHWGLREALDPTYGSRVALPPDPLLKEEMLGLKWQMTARGVQIESKDDYKLRIGRSPDRLDAVVMASYARGKTSGQRFGMRGLPTEAVTSGRNPRRR